MVCASAATNGRSNGRFSYSPIRRATSLCHRIAFPSFTDQLRSPGVKFSNDFSRAGVGAYVHSGSTSAPCRDARPGGIPVFTVSNIHEAGHGVCLGSDQRPLKWPIFIFADPTRDLSLPSHRFPVIHGSTTFSRRQIL